MHDKKVEDAPVVHPNNKVTLHGGNTDGRNLFLEVSVFDGEHTNQFRPVFDFNTSSREIDEYLKQLVDHTSPMPEALGGSIGRTVWYDTKEESYYVKPSGSTEAIRQKDGVFARKPK